jgi:pimeloyl-ACP methyl ester carboxylesterase
MHRGYIRDCVDCFDPDCRDFFLFAGRSPHFLDPSSGLFLLAVGTILGALVIYQMALSVTGNDNGFVPLMSPRRNLGASRWFVSRCNMVRMNFESSCMPIEDITMNPGTSRARTYLTSAANLAPRGAKRSSAGSRYASAAAAAALLGLLALVNHRLAKRAERDNPPLGRFLNVNGVKLHVLEHGRGEPLVLLHGNGSMVEDFVSSGLIELAASRYRVIAFDRPGHGHSTRPPGVAWTDVAQANLIAAALAEIGVPRAVILGHSWGSSVAMALALNHPAAVSALVLASGYYYPTIRADAVASTVLTIPFLGDVIRYAFSPMLSRAMWPLILRKLFGPAAVPAKFDRFPKEMTFRPSQIRASAADAALMIPDAAARRDRYGELKTPLVIIAGGEDRLIDIDEQSGRLHTDVPQSALHRVRGAGHMVHQTATHDVMLAIDEAARLGNASVPSL